MEAFVYCWTDFGTNKLYVGVHKGTPDDGYVCSSKVMLEEHTKRPNDFSREIVAFGSFKEMYVLETAILKAAKADKDPGYYNMHLNNGCYNWKGPHTEGHKSKISVSLKKSYAKQKRQPFTNKTREKMHHSRLKFMNANGQTMKKEQHPMWGTQHSPAHNNKIRLALKGKKRSLEAVANATAGRNLQIYQVTRPDGAILCVKGIVKFCRMYNLSFGNLLHRGKTKGYLCERLVKYASQ